MKMIILSGLFMLSACASFSLAQSSTAQRTSRIVVTDTTSANATPTPKHVVVTSTMPPAQAVATATPPHIVVTGSMPPVQVATSTPVPRPTQSMPVTTTVGQAQPSQASNLNYKGLSFAQIKNKIAEAKREMQTRPMTIASTEPTSGASPQTSFVRIAFYDQHDKKIDFIVLSKDAFLTPNVPFVAMSSNGRRMTTNTLRANGVNTPVTIADDEGRFQLPLLVQYPVEKGGRYIETAYYMSTHPGLVTPEVVGAGRLYVRNVIDIAREQLKNKGYAVQAKVADIAERLATVEHVDHTRFRTEFHQNIFNDIYTLYALNEGQTYRYSVSSAGAGGMVQMIPSTYQMIRNHYPQAHLMPDFVEGMRNHVNATQAMLLYMQMTWNDMVSNPTISSSLQTGVATQEKLMAAGYNSNPARLAGYIDRGGSNWTSLIPRETKIYLQIYDSLEKAVAIIPRTQ
jgi:hypothetical protein